MKTMVCVKHVPDTETKIKVGADGVSIDGAGVKWTASPFDEYAIEQALLFREAGVATDVLLVSAGPEAAQSTLRQGLAMGADRAVLIKDDRYERADGLARAHALAAVARAEEAGLILLGKYGVGTDEWLTGPMLAETLDWPHVSGVTKLEVSDGKLTAEREVEGATEIVESSLPAVVTCEKGLNEPRYASLKGIMQAKKKPIDTKSAADLGLDEAELGDGSRLVWQSLELPAPREGGRMIDGTPEEAAKELARVLREEAKVI